MPLIPALMAVLLALFAAPLAAQEVQRIAAIVNDDVISGYDLERRVELVLNTTRLQDNPETRRRLRRDVLRGLVDEKLQLQEASRNNIKVGDDEVRRALGTIARQNNVPEDRLDEFLRANGVPKAALEQQIKAELAWSKLVRRRLRSSVVVGQEEIDEAMARIRQNADDAEARVSEIFLPVDSPELEAETQRTAERLAQQIREGAPFSAVARQFSRGTTAASGGQIGWIRSGQLAPELEQAIERLQPGQLSEPVRAAGGFYVLQLHERRRAAGAGEVLLDLQRILLPEGADPAEARRVAAATQGCENAAAAAQELGAGEPNQLNSLKLDELPPPLRNLLVQLPVGRFSEPIRADEGLMLLVVCSREEGKAGLSREQVAEDLVRQRLAMLANRYMRDLRRSAVVELR
jgi:peptidyl-prolyl cis-trans isomerase SurA